MGINYSYRNHCIIYTLYLQFHFEGSSTGRRLLRCRFTADDSSFLKELEGSNSNTHFIEVLEGYGIQRKKKGLKSKKSTPVQIGEIETGDPIVTQPQLKDLEDSNLACISEKCVGMYIF